MVRLLFGIGRSRKEKAAQRLVSAMPGRPDGDEAPRNRAAGRLENPAHSK
jgi:hypothetical protein